MTEHLQNWIQAQKTTFENWINEHLKNRGESITDLETDLKNGSKLNTLYQELTNETIKRMEKKTNMKIKCLNNLNLLINKFSEKGVRVINIGAGDIFEGNLKLTLGLIWQIILKFHFVGSEGKSEGKSEKNAMNELLKFVNTLIDADIENFSKDWKDGSVLANLIHNIIPGSLPEEERPEDPLELIEKSLDVAKNEAEIPKVIEAKFIREAQDNLSLLTYTMYLKKKHDEFCDIIAPSKCVAFGEGLNDGENSENPRKVTVELKNIYGGPCDKGIGEGPLDDVDLRFEGPSSVQYNSKKVNPGVYEFEYEAIAPGKYTLDIKIHADGESIKESPFEFEITSAPVTCKGKGFEDAVIKENENLKFEVNSGTSSGALFESKDFEVEVLENEDYIVATEVVDNENGTYTVGYTPENFGRHQIVVKAWGEIVVSKDIDIAKANEENDEANAPENEKENDEEKEDLNDSNNEDVNEQEELNVLEEGEKSENDNEVETENCPVHVYGELVDTGIIPDNRMTGFIIKNEDESKSDENVKVKVEDQKGEESGKTDLKEVEKGTFQVTVDEIDTPGPYTVHVFIGDTPKKVFEVNCKHGVQPEIVEGTFTFEVHAKDSNGNPKTEGGDDWEVFIKGPNDSEIEVTKEDHGDGRYSAKYHLVASKDSPSTFTVHALLDGRHVASSPFKHELSQKPSVFSRIKNVFKKH